MTKKSGPRPTPTALKELAGNPGKRPLNKAEPKFPKGMPTCPDQVRANEYAYEVWKTDGAMLLKAGVLTRADREMFAGYCMTAARIKLVEETIAEEMKRLVSNKSNPEIKKGVFPHFTTPNEFLQEHPLIGTVTKLYKTLEAYSSAFGLNASSRARLQIHAKGPGAKTKAEREEIDLLGPVE